MEMDSKSKCDEMAQQKTIESSLSRDSRLSNSWVTNLAAKLSLILSRHRGHSGYIPALLFPMHFH